LQEGGEVKSRAYQKKSPRENNPDPWLNARRQGFSSTGRSRSATRPERGGVPCGREENGEEKEKNLRSLAIAYKNKNNRAKSRR